MIKTFVLPLAILAANTTVFAPAFAQGPLSVTSTAMVETKSRAADGTTKIGQAPARRVVPGDRVTFVVTYRNTGAAALSDVAIVNPVPRAVAFRAAANGSPAPDVSVDGRTFAPLGALRVTGPGGARAATPDDVTHVRWRLARPLAAGGDGRLAYLAVLK